MRKIILFVVLLSASVFAAEWNLTNDTVFVATPVTGQEPTTKDYVDSLPASTNSPTLLEWNNTNELLRLLPQDYANITNPPTIPSTNSYTSIVYSNPSVFSTEAEMSAIETGKVDWINFANESNRLSGIGLDDVVRVYNATTQEISVLRITGVDGNVGIGNRAYLYPGGGNDYNVAVGYYAMRTSTSADRNVAVGHYSFENANSLSDSVALGAYAGRNASGSARIFISARSVDPGIMYNPTNDTIYIDNQDLHLGTPGSPIVFRGNYTIPEAKLTNRYLAVSSGAEGMSNNTYYAFVTYPWDIPGTATLSTQARYCTGVVHCTVRDAAAVFGTGSMVLTNQPFAGSNITYSSFAVDSNKVVDVQIDGQSYFSASNQFIVGVIWRSL